jgi:hypothetical protein
MVHHHVYKSPPMDDEANLFQQAVLHQFCQFPHKNINIYIWQHVSTLPNLPQPKLV